MVFYLSFHLNKILIRTYSRMETLSETLLRAGKLRHSQNFFASRVIYDGGDDGTRSYYMVLQCILYIYFIYVQGIIITSLSVGLCN